MTEPAQQLTEDHAIKTYRYLRIGMIGAVVLMAVSIAIERSKVDCWQTSISAYYYTPVRAIFVGAMMVVGFSLIVYKGRPNGEDMCLNFAGMLAPVVAVAPTTDVGDCWSVEPDLLPVRPDGTLAKWVVDNIDNNFNALLIAGAVGLGIALFLAFAVNKGNVGKTVSTVKDQGDTSVSLGLTAIALLVGWWLSENWSDFYTRAHGWAAVLLFLFLIGAIIVKVLEYGSEAERRWRAIYAAVAVGMVLGGILIVTTRMFGRHTVFALEAWEIVLFAIYWIVQTVEKWDEKVIDAGET